MTLATPFKVVAVAFVALLFWAAVFLGVTNAILGFHFPEKWVSEGEWGSFNLSYRRAYSWVPGRVELRGLRLQGLDENVRWQVTVDRARLELRLLDLRKNRIRGDSFRAKGVTVSVIPHRKSELKMVHAKLRENRLKEPPGEPSPWRVELQGVNLENVHRAQIGRFYYTGPSQILGSFHLLPKRHLWIRDAEWELQGGQWSRGGETGIFSDFIAKVGVEFHPVDLTRVRGSQIFSSIDINAHLKSRIAEASFLSIFFPEYGTLRFGRGDGNLAGEIQVRSGHLIPPSALTADLKNIEFDLLGLRNRSTLKIRTAVHPWRAGKSEMRLAFTHRKIESFIPPRELLIQGEQLRFDGRSRKLDLVDPFTDLKLWIGARDWRIKNIGRLLSFLTESPRAEIPLRSPLSRLDLRAEVEPGKDRAEAHVYFQSRDMTFVRSGGEVDSTLTAQTRLQARLNSDSFSRGSFEVADVVLRLRDLRLQKGQKKSRHPDWKSRLHLARADVHFGEPFSFEGDFAATIGNVRVPVDFAMEPSFWLRMGVALFPLENLRGTGHVRLNTSGFALDRLEFRSGNQVVAGHLMNQAGPTEGRLYLRLLPIPFCYEAGGDDPGLSLVLSRKSCLSLAE